MSPLNNEVHPHPHLTRVLLSVPSLSSMLHLLAPLSSSLLRPLSPPSSLIYAASSCTSLLILIASSCTSLLILIASSFASLLPHLWQYFPLLLSVDISHHILSVWRMCFQITNDLILLQLSQHLTVRKNYNMLKLMPIFSDY